MLANTAAILAQIRVKMMHRIQTAGSGRPPMAKWETAPVNAVKAIMKTLVPTAVLSSYPRTEVRIKSIIIPPPAPIKPQINPMMIPQITDCMARFLADTPCIASLVVITGLTMNLIPNRESHKDGEIAHGCGWNQTGYIAAHNSEDQTVTIIIRPFLIIQILVPAVSISRNGAGQYIG